MATITMDFEVQSLVKKDKEKIDFRRFIKEYKHKKTFFIEEKIYFLFLKKVIWLFLNGGQNLGISKCLKEI